MRGGVDKGIVIQYNLFLFPVFFPELLLKLLLIMEIMDDFDQMFLTRLILYQYTFGMYPNLTSILMDDIVVIVGSASLNGLVDDTFGNSQSYIRWGIQYGNMLSEECVH